MVFGHNINKYYLKYFGLILIGFLALLAVDYFQLEIPELIGNIINSFSDGSINKDMMIDFVKWTILIACVMFSGRILWRICILGLSRRVSADIRKEMFYHSEKLSQRYYQENKTGALMALYTNDIETITESFGSGIVMTVDAIFLGAFSFYRMIMINWVLALICTIPLLALACCGGIIGKVMGRKWDERQKAFEEMSDFTQENFSGISVVKAFVKEALEFKNFAKVNKKNLDKNISFIRYNTIVGICVGVLISSVIVIIVGFGGYLVYQNSIGNPGILVGDLTKFISYFGTLTWPMMAIANLINMCSQARASLKRIDALIDEKVEIIDDKVVDVKKINGTITFNHFNFSYPNSDIEILHDICLTIEKGTMVGLIGRTGSGKTTLVDSLLRVYNVNENEIFIDGIDIMKIPFKKVREAIGYVPQDNFLFSDTIKNNISFSGSFSDDEIRSATEFSDVHDNIMEFKDGYETVLGERGVTISGGQKQRISIARAIIKNPEILILDDSVSAVDTKTEEKIIDNIKRERKGKTTILIAHRISTVKNLDKVLLIDDGRIVDYGTHDELLERSTLYNEMVQLQKLEDEVEGK